MTYQFNSSTSIWHSTLFQALKNLYDNDLQSRISARKLQVCHISLLSARTNMHFPAKRHFLVAVFWWRNIND